MESSPETLQDASLHYTFELPPEKLLPAVCPDCGAPGTRPHRVQNLSAVSAPGDETPASRDAFYCDLCADEKNSAKTRSIALFAACGLITLSVGTATALAWGSRALALQVALTGGAAALPALGLTWRGFWPIRNENVWMEETAESTSLVCRTRAFRRALIEHGFVEHSTAPGSRNFSVGQLPRRALALCLLGFMWLGLLHSLGATTVRVLVSGNERAVLLVDGRHTGLIEPTNDEDPQGGILARVLGGRRTLALYSSAGEMLGQQTATLWPGRTYIIAHLAPGDCLFWEKRAYGERSRPSNFSPLGGVGPVWELEEHVDSWFIPLQTPGQATPESEDDWRSSGGIRRAIRLLPCRPGSPE